MKDRWWMITLIGRDAPGIVAALTRMPADAAPHLGAITSAAPYSSIA